MLCLGDWIGPAGAVRGAIEDGAWRCGPSTWIRGVAPVSSQVEPRDLDLGHHLAP